MTALRVTTAASGALRALVIAQGPVVLVASRRHAAEPMCFGAADYVPGPHDVLAGYAEGCAVYLDRRDQRPGRLVLDLAADRSLGFLLRRPASIGAQRPKPSGRRALPEPSPLRESSGHHHFAV